MSDTNWKYTAAEKREIDAAWNEVSCLMDERGHREPHRLREALKVERRERSCVTAAKALLVRGFAEGMNDDPRASTIAGYSEGIAAAVMLGADWARSRPALPQCQRARLLLDAANAAHEAYITRGLAAARRGCEAS